MKIYAMDISFYHSFGMYQWPARCAMLKDLGYDATHLTLCSEAEWALLGEVAHCKNRYGLDVEAVHVRAVAEDTSRWKRICDELIPALPSGCAMELTISTQESGDVSGPVEEGLAQVLAAADTHHVEIRLYAHRGFWLETTAQAVEWVKRFANPRLGITFSGFHWYAGDARSLPDVLTSASPHLFGANICGSRPGGALHGYTIENVDQGHLDNFMLVAQLQAAKYRGSIGIQGYANGGDVYSNLKQSLQALQSINERLKNHPDWADFTWEPTPHLSSLRGPQ